MKGDRRPDILCLVTNIMVIFLQYLPVYSSEGKAMMAEILRDDQLNERW